MGCGGGGNVLRRGQVEEVVVVEEEEEEMLGMLRGGANLGWRWCVGGSACARTGRGQTVGGR